MADEFSAYGASTSLTTGGLMFNVETSTVEKGAL